MQKPKIKIDHKSLSELRRDLVTGDWVLIATGRAKRPNAFVKAERKIFNQPKDKCPFENPQEFGNDDPLLVYAKDGKRRTIDEWRNDQDDWLLQVVPNKFPAVNSGICDETYEVGPYLVMDGVGSHEVIITRDHKITPFQSSLKETELLFNAYKERYLALKNRKCVRYVSIFYNHGKESGASISHPHSQLIAIPMIPQDVKKSLVGSEKYYSNHKKCVHCVMLEWEMIDKKRIVFENELAIAFCPFISRTAFEVRVFPKIHQPYFEQINDKEIKKFSEAVRISLNKIYKGLKDPAYNFFIHTSPIEGEENWHYYHWHIEILPKTGIWAGFELGTGIEISTIEPEKAAEYLRGIKI
jgi:UDPglucose--hexose-1-phosphate uridylyltransferase